MDVANVAQWMFGTESEPTRLASADYSQYSRLNFAV
jgi:hypothetical protein